MSSQDGPGRFFNVPGFRRANHGAFARRDRTCDTSGLSRLPRRATPAKSASDTALKKPRIIAPQRKTPAAAGEVRESDAHAMRR
jgi:hypothetical protein